MVFLHLNFTITKAFDLKLVEHSLSKNADQWIFEGFCVFKLMSKVITFSRFFPKNHIRAGEPTYFVEKIWSGLNDRIFDGFYKTELSDHWVTYQKMFRENTVPLPKFHTIRKGNRWKVGDKFSPRVWSGLPRRSKQITFAPDIEIVKIWDFEIRNEYSISDILVNKIIFATNDFIDFAELGNQSKLAEIAENDGLSIADFCSWFELNDREKIKDFQGQILCWNKDIEY